MILKYYHVIRVCKAEQQLLHTNFACIIICSYRVTSKMHWPRPRALKTIVRFTETEGTNKHHLVQSQSSPQVQSRVQNYLHFKVKGKHINASAIIASSFCPPLYHKATAISASRVSDCSSCFSSSSKVYVAILQATKDMKT